MNTKLAFQSLVMDLKRVALGFYSGSNKTAEVFIKESLKRMGEIDRKKAPEYINTILDKLPGELKLKDKMALAERALTYSVIIQNYTLTNFN